MDMTRTSPAVALLAAIIMTTLIALAATPQAIAANALPALRVALLDYTPEPVQPGQPFDLVLEVSNTGNPTSDAWLEVVPEYPFTVLDTQDVVRAKSLGVVSGTQKLQFRLQIADDAHDGATPLRVRYGTSRSDGTYQEVEFTIQVQTFDAQLSLDKVEQTPIRLEPGQEGTLRFTLTNYDDKPLKNVDLTLDLTNTHDVNTEMDNIVAVQAMINARLEDVNRRVAAGLSPLSGATPMGVTPDGKPVQVQFTAIAPMGTGTLKRIGTIMPGETVITQFSVRALPDVQPDIYAIPIYISYNDEDNNPFHVRTEVPVTVDMAPDALIEIQRSTLRSTDFEGQVVVRIANQGLSELRYASLALTPSENYTILTAPDEVYLGTLAPGESANATFTILSNTEDLRLPVTLRYRDSFNRKQEENRTLELAIINRNYYRDMPYEMLAVWAVLGLVLLALTAYVIRFMTKR